MKLAALTVLVALGALAAAEFPLAIALLGAAAVAVGLAIQPRDTIQR